MSRVTQFSEWLLKQPVVWGGLACLAFYAFVVQNAPEGSTLQRYFNNHEVEYITTVLFFIGAASLVLKLVGVVAQWVALDAALLPRVRKGGESIDRVDSLLADLNDGPEFLRDSYQVSRLREALTYVKRKGSADALDAHLARLEEADAVRMHQSYASVMVVSGVIPILGFLGTVIGITMAIARLSGTDMEASLPKVIDGLSVAFDTTALALALSIVLLFLKFAVERIETRLLAAVDSSVEDQMVGRFCQYGTDADPNLVSVRRSSEELLAAVRASAQEQNRLLVGALDSTNRRWADMVDQTRSILSDSLTESVGEGLALHAKGLNEGVAAFASDLEQTLIRHAEILNEGLIQHSETVTAGVEAHRGMLRDDLAQHSATLGEALSGYAAQIVESEASIAEENRRHLGDVEAAVGEALLMASSRQEKLIAQSERILTDMQSALVESAGTTVAQQEQLIKQGEILLRLLNTTGHLRQLEDTLNSNLGALVGSQRFEETLAGISAVMQLLAAKLGKPLNFRQDPSPVPLDEEAAAPQDQGAGQKKAA